MDSLVDGSCDEEDKNPAKTMNFTGNWTGEKAYRWIWRKA
jgi:hypothetical protein